MTPRPGLALRERKLIGGGTQRPVVARPPRSNKRLHALVNRLHMIVEHWKRVNSGALNPSSRLRWYGNVRRSLAAPGARKPQARTLHRGRSRRTRLWPTTSTMIRDTGIARDWREMEAGVPRGA